MKIELKYDNKADIPSGYEELYTEKDDTWVLTGVQGMKTQDDIDRLREGNKRERTEHAETKKQLKKFDGLDPDKIHDQIEELEELRLSGDKNNKDDKDVDELVEQRVKRRIAPLERERDQLKEKLDTSETKITDLEKTITTGEIHDVLRAAALDAKVQPTAVEDILLTGDRVFERTEDGEVLSKDGAMTPSDWLNQQMKEQRPHWWPPTEGGGSQGSNGTQFPNNPWSKDGWDLTAQAAAVSSKGMAKAEQMAKAAGSEVGATQPPE